MTKADRIKENIIPRRAPYEKSAGYLFPYLGKEFNEDLNKFSIYEIYPSSSAMIWFNCEKGHSYNMSVASRTHKGTGCNVCSGHVIVSGVNDLKTLFPDIAAEMDAANNDVLSSKVGAGVGKVFNFRCHLGHEFSSRIDNRTSSKTGCPYCCNQKVLQGYNDLATLYPEVTARFDYEKNDLLPQQIIPFSTKKYYFKCENNHSYLISVGNLTRLGTNCKYCKRVDVWPGFNDLQTILPELADEFDSERNRIMPTHVSAFSGMKKYWWKCKDGHSFQATPKNRAYRGDGCIHCSGSQTSNIEKLIKKELTGKILFKVRSVENSVLPLKWRKNSMMKIDILGENYQGDMIAVEYDGSYWHRDASNFTRDIDKTHALLEAGYKVVRIRDGDLRLLPIHHENLLQFNNTWKTPYASSLDKIVTTMKMWL
jgi:hypothetical protein